MHLYACPNHFATERIRLGEIWMHVLPLHRKTYFEQTRVRSRYNATRAKSLTSVYPSPDTKYTTTKIPPTTTTSPPK